MSKKVWSLIVVIVLLVGVMLYSAMTGSLKVDLSQLMTGLWTGTDDQVNVWMPK
ncbi:hypothetical protein [Paenibacillus polymyxa]|uniref:hypothetical protein n=1 Tax=Paenibacillus polymyxa TaxID=1406 RepID=UPI0003D36125|nr:hypothetical protein [Paenibacillus polymyxa]